MNKHLLVSKIKSVNKAYFFWLFGFQYLYLGKIGTQILYFLTLGGFGLWTLIDLFTLSGRVKNMNAAIYDQIEGIEYKEKNDDLARNIALIQASKNN